jgi:hypothetical protein
MVSKHSVRKVSVWEDVDGPAPTLTDTDAHLYDKSRHWKLKVPKDDIAESDIPDQSLTDWCITVTTTRGEHVHGEISHYTKANYRTLKWPKNNSVQLVP